MLLEHICAYVLPGSLCSQKVTSPGISSDTHNCDPFIGVTMSLVRKKGLR